MDTSHRSIKKKAQGREIQYTLEIMTGRARAEELIPPPLYSEPRKAPKATKEPCVDSIIVVFVSEDIYGGCTEYFLLYHLLFLLRSPSDRR